MSARPPIVLAELYSAVVDRTDGRCQCDGSKTAAGCGDPHRVSIGTCDTYGQAGTPLLVVPADPMVAVHIAAGLTADDLVALCRACVARRASRVRRWRREGLARELAEQQDSLF